MLKIKKKNKSTTSREESNADVVLNMGKFPYQVPQTLFLLTELALTPYREWVSLSLCSIEI